MITPSTCPIQHQSWSQTITIQSSIALYHCNTTLDPDPIPTQHLVTNTIHHHHCTPITSQQLVNTTTHHLSHHCTTAQYHTTIARTQPSHHHLHLHCTPHCTIAPPTHIVKLAAHFLLRCTLHTTIAPYTTTTIAPYTTTTSTIAMTRNPLLYHPHTIDQHNTITNTTSTPPQHPKPPLDFSTIENKFTTTAAATKTVITNSPLGPPPHKTPSNPPPSSLLSMCSRHYSLQIHTIAQVKVVTQAEEAKWVTSSCNGTRPRRRPRRRHRRSWLQRRHRRVRRDVRDRESKHSSSATMATPSLTECCSCVIVFIEWRGCGGRR